MQAADAAAAARIDVARAPQGRGLIAGLVAFGLLLPLIGFSTVQNIRNELILRAALAAAVR